MTDFNRDEFIQKMNKLKGVYDACLGEWREELQQYQKKMDSWTYEDTSALQAITHKLNGTAATYGYPNISDAARSLEYKLAYANVGFKIGGPNPNRNEYIVSELRSLIHLCMRVHAEGDIARMEREAYGDEIDEFIHEQKLEADKKTVLVVDDQDIIRETIGLALSSAGFNVMVAQDGDDALLIMDKQAPDLVVLDRVMPHLDGMMVLKTMRRRKKLEDVPVIFLTALYSPEDVILAEKLGAVGYVQKPVHPDEFVATCIKALRGATKA